MKIKFSALLAAAVVVSSSLMSSLGSLPVSAVAQTCTWTGTAGDKKFSTAANWSNCSSAAPLAGDNLTFNSDNFLTPDSVSLTNDLNLAFGDVQIIKGTNAIASGVFGILIDALKLVDGGSVRAASSSFTLSLQAATTVSPLESTGSVTVAGQVNSTYNVAGTITFENPTIGDFSIFSISPNDTVGGVKIGSDVNVRYYVTTDVTTKTLPFTIQYLSTSSLFGVSAYCAQATSMTCLQEAPTSYTLTSPMLLAGDATVHVGSGATLNLATVTGGTLTKTADSSGILNIGGNSVVQPTKTTECTDAKPTDYVGVAENETYIMKDGCERSVINVFSGGILKGNNTVDTKLAGLYISKGAFVAPGLSPGCITSDTLNLQGTYQFEIGGTTACSGYDQLQVTNTSMTTPTTVFGAESVLSTSLFNKFIPKKDQTYTIISVAGTQPVQGTFTGLVEGATFTQNGVLFKITYKGGDGNDVVLTVLGTPGIPNTGFELIRSNPIMTTVIAGFAAAVLVAFGRKLRAHRR
ncbi:MAG: hypothetical protein WBB39_03770 [Candidatus Saccharimonadales bacterium]